MIVEANSSSQSPESLAEIEEQIFETIDEEIRESHNFCKDLVLQWKQKIENLARKHLQFANERLSNIRINKRDVAQMTRREAYQDMIERVKNILLTEQHRDRFLIGQLADFLDVDGQVCNPKILEGFKPVNKQL